MAGSRVVPHVDSTSVRIAVPAAVIPQLEAMAGEVGLSRDELLELMIRANVPEPESTAAELWARYTSGPTQTPMEIRSVLANAGVRDAVRGLRLGAPEPDKVAIPWSRPGTGVELGWSPVECWPVVRGLWRLDPAGVHVIVGLRLGRAVGVYRVDGWLPDPDTGRRFAVGGKVITATGDLLDAETGDSIGAASADDRAIYAAVTAGPIVHQNRQPVVKLSQR